MFKPNLIGADLRKMIKKKKKKKKRFQTTTDYIELKKSLHTEKILD